MWKAAGSIVFYNLLLVTVSCNTVTFWGSEFDLSVIHTDTSRCDHRLWQKYTKQSHKVFTAHNYTMMFYLRLILTGIALHFHWNSHFLIVLMLRSQRLIQSEEGMNMLLHQIYFPWHTVSTQLHSAVTGLTRTSRPCWSFVCLCVLCECVCVCVRVWSGTHHRGFPRISGQDCVCYFEDKQHLFLPTNKVTSLVLTG